MHHPMILRREIENSNFAPGTDYSGRESDFRLVDWNTDRGLKLAGIIDAPESANADLIVLRDRYQSEVNPSPQYST